VSQLALATVHRCDCRDLAAEMVAAGILVDSIITSPPYPQGKKNPEDMGRYRRTGTAEEQRGHIHGHPNAKGETGLEVRIHAPDWLPWFLDIAAALKPCLKPNGNFVVNVDSCCYPTRHRHWGVYSLPERMEAQGWCFVEEIVWTKPNGPPVSASTRFHHSHEKVYWFANGDRWAADIDAVRTEHAEGSLPQFARGLPPPRDLSLRPWANSGSQWAERGGGYPQAAPNEKGARPKDVFSCPVGGTRWDPVGGAHFAAMPLGLAEWIVKWATKEGEIVFDPFGGAGTTPVACIRLGRRWVMAEVTEAAAVIAERRIQLATQGFMDEEIQPEMPQQMLPLAGRE